MAKARFTQSKDGKPRLSFTIKYRMDSESIAVHFLSASQGTPAEIQAAAESTSLPVILEMVKTDIDRYGTETPYYRVGDDSDLSAIEDAVKAIFARRFAP